MENRFIPHGCRRFRNFFIFLFLLTLLGFYPGSAGAVPGAVDTSFGNLGFVVTDFAGDNDRANGMALQPDGKIVAAGTAFVDGDDDFAVARYNPDGTLDTTFNPSGTTPGLVTTDISGNDDNGQAVVIQPDGKIVVAGTAHVSGNDDFAVVRYEANGDLDSTFNASGSPAGVFTRDVSGADLDDRAAAVAIHDGKIVVVGVVRGDDNDFAVMRLGDTGELDSTFNPSGSPAGIVITDASGADKDDEASGVAIQTDGKIVAVGQVSVDTNDNDFILVRYEEDGDPDPTFNSTGIVTTDFNSGSFESAFSVAIQPDGKIVAAGFTSDLSDNDYAVARYETDGDLDSTFNSTGKVITDFTDVDDVAHAVAIQPDGKIVVAGFFSDDDLSIDDFSLARYNTDGTLDTSGFNSSGPLPGRAITDFFGVNLDDSAHAVAIQPDGKVVAVGESGSGGTPNFALVRYQGNSADLKIAKSASASSVIVGDSVTYTLTVTNNSLQPADGVVVTDTLTGAVSFGTISASQGSCSGTDLLTCDLGTLAGGASATVSVSVTTTGVGGISNIAKVTALTADPDPTNNLALAFVNVSAAPVPPEPPPPSADLSITKASDSPFPAVGDVVTYTISVTNQGPDAATGVVVTDVLLGTFHTVSASSNQGSCTVSGPVICNLGTLDNGGIAHVKVILTVGDFGNLSDVATVVSQTNDPDLGNNSASLNSSVKSPPVGGGGCTLTSTEVLGGLWSYLLSIPVLMGLRSARRRRKD